MIMKTKNNAIKIYIFKQYILLKKSLLNTNIDIIK